MNETELLAIAEKMVNYAYNFQRDMELMDDPVANDPLGMFLNELKDVATRAEKATWIRAEKIVEMQRKITNPMNERVKNYAHDLQLTLEMQFRVHGNEAEAAALNTQEDK